MSVLVTGGAGYIGSHMTHELLGDGEKVVVIDNLSTGHRWAVPQQAAFEKGDIGDPKLVARVIRDYKVRAIVHFAGSIVVPDSIADPLGYYLNNTSKSRSLIQTAMNSSVRHFIFSSTAAVYGMPEMNPVSEAAPTQPISPYGSSKLMTEWMLRDAAAAHDLRYMALRYFNVAGADPQGRTGQSTPQATHLIKVACQAALGQRTHLDIFGTDYPTPDGTCLRDYIHVSDLAKAHVAALKYLRAGGVPRVLNCGYGRGFSVLEVIDAVKRASGVDFMVKDAPRRPGDPAALIADARSIRRFLDWKPEFADLDMIAQAALRWERHLERFRKAS